MGDDQYCLKWNNHQTTILTNLMDNERLTDCILFTEGRMMRAHQVILSACSPYLESLLNESRVSPGGIPILIFNDIKFEELSAMKEYMYKGEVNICQDNLDSFLKVANSLQIKGLSDRTGGDNGEGGKRKAEASPDPGRRFKRKESKESDASYDEPSNTNKRQQVIPSNDESILQPEVTEIKIEPGIESEPTIKDEHLMDHQKELDFQAVVKDEPPDDDELETFDLTGLDDDDDDEDEECEMSGPSQSNVSAQVQKRILLKQQYPWRFTKGGLLRLSTKRRKRNMKKLSELRWQKHRAIAEAKSDLAMYDCTAQDHGITDHNMMPPTSSQERH